MFFHPLKTNKKKKKTQKQKTNIVLTDAEKNL